MEKEFVTYATLNRLMCTIFGEKQFLSHAATKSSGFESSVQHLQRCVCVYEFFLILYLSLCVFVCVCMLNLHTGVYIRCVYFRVCVCVWLGSQSNCSNKQKQNPLVLHSAVAIATWVKVNLIVAVVMIWIAQRVVPALYPSGNMGHIDVYTQ